MSDTIIQTKGLGKGEYLETVVKRRMPRPSFKAVGAKAMNGIEILVDMTAHEALVFKLLVEKMDYRDNIAEYGTAKLSATDKVKFSKGLTSLMAKDLVKRIKKGRPSIYMVNPDLIQPAEYEAAVVKYNKLPQIGLVATHREV